MRRAAALALAAALLAAPGAGAALTAQQELFRDALLADPGTTAAIERLLRDGGAHVARDARFADLTGDGRADAVVRVRTPGAAGAVAAYVLSTHGREADAPLRSAFRSQRLYRASAVPVEGALRLRTALYRRGDELCCPATIRQRTYTWSARAERFVLRETVEFDGPR